MKRGDSRSFKLAIGKKEYVSGQTITFMAKPKPDNDPTNQQAVVNRSFGDSDIIERTDTHVVYLIKIQPGDTENIAIDKDELKLACECEIRDSTGRVKTLPSGKNMMNWRFIQI